jgi:hypothetical protein
MEQQHQRRILYGWAYARDFNAESAWAQPVALSSPAIIRSPDIVLIHAANNFTRFAVPLNENRGIYLARSLDGGIVMEHADRDY